MRRLHKLSLKCKGGYKSVIAVLLWVVINSKSGTNCTAKLIERYYWGYSDELGCDSISIAFL